jgi:hypothetical protein
VFVRAGHVGNQTGLDRLPGQGLLAFPVILLGQFEVDQRNLGVFLLPTMQLAQLLLQAMGIHGQKPALLGVVGLEDRFHHPSSQKSGLGIGHRRMVAQKDPCRPECAMDLGQGLGKPAIFGSGRSRKKRGPARFIRKTSGRIGQIEVAKSFRPQRRERLLHPGFRRTLVVLRRDFHASRPAGMRVPFQRGQGKHGRVDDHLIEGLEQIQGRIASQIKRHVGECPLPGSDGVPPEEQTRPQTGP